MSDILLFFIYTFNVSLVFKSVLYHFHNNNNNIHAIALQNTQYIKAFNCIVWAYTKLSSSIILFFISIKIQTQYFYSVESFVDMSL